MLATSWLSSRRDKELKPLKSVKRTVTRAWSNWVSFSPCSPDRKSTRLNSSHSQISYAVFCLKKKTAYKKSREIVMRSLHSQEGLHSEGDRQVEPCLGFLQIEARDLAEAVEAVAERGSVGTRA